MTISYDLPKEMVSISCRPVWHIVNKVACKDALEITLIT